MCFRSCQPSVRDGEFRCKFVRQKLESEERNILLTILRTTGVVTLIEEDKAGRMVAVRFCGVLVRSSKSAGSCVFHV
jgi:hypothetical protein